MSEENVEVVRRLFDAVERRDLAGVIASYDENIVIHEASSLPQPCRRPAGTLTFSNHELANDLHFRANSLKVAPTASSAALMFSNTCCV